MLRPQPDPDTFAGVVRPATHAADMAWVAGPREATTSERVSGAVEAALRCLIGNGLITVTDRATWPTWIALDPPYDPDRAMPRSTP